MPTTLLFQANSIFGSASARSAMIFEARSSSRRCTMVTFEANRVRKVASSTAESPPPTTTISWLRKKNPSQVAHQDTPWPDSRFSSGSPSSRYAEPVARITARAWNVWPPPVTTVLTGSVSRSSTASS